MAAKQGNKIVGPASKDLAKKVRSWWNNRFDTRYGTINNVYSLTDGAVIVQTTMLEQEVCRQVVNNVIRGEPNAR